MHKLLRVGLLGLFVYALIHSAQLTRDANLIVTIVDADTGKPTTARVRLEGANGVRPRVTGALSVSETAIPIPKEAVGVLYGRNDRSEGYLLQPDGSFYVDGEFRVQQSHDALLALDHVQDVRVICEADVLDACNVSVAWHLACATIRARNRRLAGPGAICRLSKVRQTSHFIDTIQ